MDVLGWVFGIGPGVLDPCLPAGLDSKGECAVTSTHETGGSTGHTLEILGWDFVVSGSAALYHIDFGPSGFTRLPDSKCSTPGLLPKAATGAASSCRPCLRGVQEP